MKYLFTHVLCVKISLSIGHVWTVQFIPEMHIYVNTVKGKLPAVSTDDSTSAYGKTS